MRLVFGLLSTSTDDRAFSVGPHSDPADLVRLMSAAVLWGGGGPFSLPISQQGAKRHARQFQSPSLNEYNTHHDLKSLGRVDDIELRRRVIVRLWGALGYHHRRINGPEGDQWRPYLKICAASTVYEYKIDPGKK